MFHETLNFAALRKLPVLFICENNLYATNTHIRDRQSQTDIYKRAESYAMPGVLADGNDVWGVYGEAEKAVKRARQGQGPTLLEFRTYRFLEHCGIHEDLDLGYLTAEEIKTWRAKDPLKRAKDFVGAADERKMSEEIEAMLEKAFSYAKASPFPNRLFAEKAAGGI